MGVRTWDRSTTVPENPRGRCGGVGAFETEGGDTRGKSTFCLSSGILVGPWGGVGVGRLWSRVVPLVTAGVSATTRPTLSTSTSYSPAGTASCTTGGSEGRTSGPPRHRTEPGRAGEEEEGHGDPRPDPPRSGRGRGDGTGSQGQGGRTAGGPSTVRSASATTASTTVATPPTSVGSPCATS